MFQICGLVVNFFCWQFKKGSENTKKTRIFSKEEIKQQLNDSIINNDTIKTEELNEKANKTEKPPEDNTTIIKQYEDIIHTKKKNISIAYHQEKFLKDSKTRKSSLD